MYELFVSVVTVRPDCCQQGRIDPPEVALVGETAADRSQRRRQHCDTWSSRLPSYAVEIVLLQGESADRFDLTWAGGALLTGCAEVVRAPSRCSKGVGGGRNSRPHRSRCRGSLYISGSKNLGKNSAENLDGIDAVAAVTSSQLSAHRRRDRSAPYPRSAAAALRPRSAARRAGVLCRTTCAAGRLAGEQRPARRQHPAGSEGRREAECRWRRRHASTSAIGRRR